MNSVRSQLAEFGIIAAHGPRRLRGTGARVDAGRSRYPSLALERAAAADRADRGALNAAIDDVGGSDHGMRQRDSDAAAHHHPRRRRADRACRGHRDRRRRGSSSSARDFAAWCGLTRTPARLGRQDSARPASRRQGDHSLRKLFALGASNLMRHARSQRRATAWQRGILARRPVKVAVLAQAAKDRPRRLGLAGIRRNLSRRASTEPGREH